MNGWPRRGAWRERRIPPRHICPAGHGAPNGRPRSVRRGGWTVQEAARLVGIRPSTVKRHMADLRARLGLTTVELIYAGRAAGWLVVPSLEPS